MLQSVVKKDEGDIVLAQNMVLPVSQSNLLAYVTQRGSLYFYDVRARHAIQTDQELLGCQKGIPTCMTIGQNPYHLYFGTLGGYLMIYDVRYNTISSQ